MYAVVDKHHVLAAVHKVQNSLCGVAVTKKTNKKRKHYLYGNHIVNYREKQLTTEKNQILNVGAISGKRLHSSFLIHTLPRC